MTTTPRRLPLDVIAAEANKYFDAQAIIDVLVSAGMSADMIAMCIKMKESRDIHEVQLFMVGIMDRLDLQNDIMQEIRHALESIASKNF